MSTHESLEWAYNVFDIVSDEYGNVGIIVKVSFTDNPQAQVQAHYSIEWLTGHNHKVSWFLHKDLHLHCNLFAKLATITQHNHHNINTTLDF